MVVVTVDTHLRKSSSSKSSFLFDWLPTEGAGAYDGILLGFEAAVFFPKSSKPNSSQSSQLSWAAPHLFLLAPAAGIAGFAGGYKNNSYVT